ncbi:hypothetical protein GCM10028862_02380 [Luteimonas pelagia]
MPEKQVPRFARDDTGRGGLPVKQVPRFAREDSMEMARVHSDLFTCAQSVLLMPNRRMKPSASSTPQSADWA